MRNAPFLGRPSRRSRRSDGGGSDSGGSGGSGGSNGSGSSGGGGGGGDRGGGLGSFIYDDDEDDSDSDGGRGRSRRYSDDERGGEGRTPPCVVEHDVSTCSLLSTRQSGNVFEGFKEHDDRRTAEVTRLLAELDDLLYSSAAAVATVATSTTVASARPKNSTTVDAGAVATAGAKTTSSARPSPPADEIDSHRRNNLVRRHNFETHNRPQAQHLAPRVEEWTQVFPHFRVCGTAVPPLVTPVAPASTTLSSGENRVLLHNPASERPLLYRPGSPLRTPRENLDSYGGSSLLFLQGRRVSIDVAAADNDDGGGAEIILASHGQCTEWIECDGSLGADTDDINTTAEQRNKKESNKISKGLPPIEPAAAMHDALLSEVFDTLWFKLTPLILPLVRYIMKNILDLSPFGRHDARARTPSPQRRRAGGVVRNPRSVCGGGMGGGSVGGGRGGVDDDGSRFTISTTRWERDADIGGRDETQKHAPNRAGGGAQSASAGVGFGDAMTITPLHSAGASMRKVSTAGSYSLSSFSPPKGGRRTRDRPKPHNDDSSGALAGMPPHHHDDLYADGYSNNLTSGRNSGNMHATMSIRAKSAGRRHNSHPLRPKPSSARSRKAIVVGGAGAAGSAHNLIRGPGSFAGNAVQASTNLDGNSSAIRAGGFRMQRPGARDSAFRPSSLAMAGERSFRTSNHGRSVFAAQNTGVRGAGGAGGGGGGLHKQRQQHGDFRGGGGGGGGARARAGRYQQPALFQFEDPFESRGQPAAVAAGAGGAALQLPFLEQGALLGGTGGGSPKRVRTALPAIGGARGGGFNMLPTDHHQQHAAHHHHHTAWAGRRR